MLVHKIAELVDATITNTSRSTISLEEDFHISSDQLTRMSTLIAEQPNGTFKFIKAVTAVGLASALADGEITEEEVNNFFIPFFAVIDKHLDELKTQELIELIATPPDTEQCIEYISELGNNIDIEFFDAIIEFIAKADYKFCVKEKKFLDEFRLKTNRVMAIPVVATMSSGKSTLVNALLGKNLLPAENQACTATLFKIEDYAGVETPIIRHTHPKDGVSDWTKASLETLTKWNTTEATEVEILGNFLSSERKSIHTILYDTPGPNNSMDKSHEKVTYSILSGASYGHAIVVLNAEQSGIDDEYELLEKLKEISEDNQNIHINFVLNKFDCFDVDVESIAQGLQNTSNQLAEIGFKNRTLIPTMSKLAVEIRELINAGNTDHWSIRKQKRVHSDLIYLEEHQHEYIKALTHNSLCERLYNKVQKKITNLKYNKIKIADTSFDLERLRKIELLTGVPLLEELLIATRIISTNNKIFNRFKQSSFDESKKEIPSNVINKECGSLYEDPGESSSCNTKETTKSSIKEKKMLSIELAYNPYLVETKIQVDGNELPESHELIDKYKTKRIQSWIDSFFVDIVNVFNERNISLKTDTTPQDSKDIKEALSRFEQSDSGKSVKITLTTNEHNHPVDDKISQLTELFEKAKNGPFDEFKGEALECQFNDALSPDFEVNVVATMSSGKSTVINALLGQDLMPAKNEACTATVAYIGDKDGKECFGGFCKDCDGNTVEAEDPVTKEHLAEWNMKREVSTLHLHGDIKTIEDADFAQLILVDTPGPNNSRDESHRKITLEAINRKPLSMVLYVLNSTQLNIDDDASLLQVVSNAMSVGGRQAQDRFVFIANKIDAFDPEQGESVASAMENARNYLKQNGIENPLLIPVSAELAKLLRMKRKGLPLTRTQRNNLATFTELFVEEEEMNMLMHSKSSISPSVYQRLQTKLQNCSSDEDKAEIYSGIPIIEELLNEFLLKHAVPAKIKDAVDCFGHVMAKAEGLQRLNDQLQKGEEELKSVAKRLKQFEDSQERTAMAKNFRDKVKTQDYRASAEITKTLKNIELEIFNFIDQHTDMFAGEEYSLSKAEMMIEKLQNKCQGLSAQIHNIITEGLNENFISILENIRLEYEENIAELLNKKFPSVEDSELVAFQKNELKMPSTKRLIESNKYEEKVAVGTREVSTSKWWNPFSWGSSKTVTDYEYRDKVNMSNLWDEIRDELYINHNRNKNNAKQQAEKQAQTAKSIALKAMDDIDQLWTANMEKIRIASVDQQAKQELINNNKKKLNWYEDFSHELKQVLSL
ncbi:dynamin family protein [Maridesulfovibrio sp.]|uniref:dynamin family protein n=1 Tax=Maridesulfovibrio sp. TaxID=2795000 RepID=UPI0029CA8162|nr:dynamin family protein [Maridesulfovibrio sp.]